LVYTIVAYRTVSVNTSASEAEVDVCKYCVLRPAPRLSCLSPPPSSHLHYAGKYPVCMLSLFCSKGNGLPVTCHAGTEGE
jgi:hypothetical protein